MGLCAVPEVEGLIKRLRERANMAGHPLNRQFDTEKLCDDLADALTAERLRAEKAERACEFKDRTNKALQDQIKGEATIRAETLAAALATALSALRMISLSNDGVRQAACARDALDRLAYASPAGQASAPSLSEWADRENARELGLPAGDDR